MTEPKKKMFIFQQSNKKAPNLMVKKDFFKKNYKRSKNRGHFQFFSIYKKIYLLSLENI